MVDLISCLAWIQKLPYLDENGLDNYVYKSVFVIYEHFSYSIPFCGNILQKKYTNILL